MKKKKKSDLATLLGYAGGHKGLTFLGLVLSAVAMLLSMAPYICIWLVDSGTKRHPVWLAGLCLCSWRHCDILCWPNVYSSGSIPYGVQHPQARCCPCNEGSIGVL